VEFGGEAVHEGGVISVASEAVEFAPVAKFAEADAGEGTSEAGVKAQTAQQHIVEAEDAEAVVARKTGTGHRVPARKPLLGCADAAWR
jgi:hypothetical protein